MAVPLLLAAPDKFRGTATAREVASAIALAAAHSGWSADEVPMADGGEGVLDVLPGRMRHTLVHGPLGRTVEAEWRLDGDTAVIEMARASGLALVGGPERNRALDATTRGTGELIAAAIAAGAKRVIVGLGGSATTDGGQACIEALRPHARLSHVEVIAACDVTTGFVDAAETFAPQKGASAGEVRLLRRRLESLAQEYQREYGVDVTTIESAGAAGGLAGGLAVLGARLVGGFDLIADTVDLADRVEAADLVITGEGFLDAQSFDGKVVGGVLALAAGAARPALVVVGQVVDPEAVTRVQSFGGTVIALAERYGLDRSLSQPLACIEEVVAEYLGSV